MYHNHTVNKWHYAPGHARVLYEVWIGNDRSSINHTLKNDFSYVIESNPEFEPYFLCYGPGLPKYWENFRGFGFDKSSFTQELALKKYEFRVLWDYFVIHLHHERERDSQDRNGLANRNGNIWWNEFTPYLLNKYQPKGMDERFLYPRFVDYYRISRQRKDKK